MKQGWTYKKIKDVAKVFAGQGAPQGDSNYNLEGTPFVKAGNLSDLINGESESSIQKVSEEVAKSHKLKLYKAGSVLFAKSGMSCMKGFVYTLKSDCYVVSHLAIITPHSVNSHFLNYYLCYNKPNSLIKDEAYPSISLKDIENLQIPIPPLAEQERIVAELDLLSGIIEKKKAQLKAYDQLAQSIFYNMFGDIEEDTPVSEYISALSGGKSLAGETECKNKVLKTGAVTYDYFRGNEVKNLPTDYQPIKEHLLNDGDILISRMNTLEYVGACAYVWKAPLNTYLPDRLWRATLKDNINPIFLWFSLIQDKAKEQIRSMASGTSGSMKNISIPRFLTVKIKCIPLSLQQEFAEKVEAIERQKALVQQSIEQTQTLFDYTMDKYFG